MYFDHKKTLHHIMHKPVNLFVSVVILPSLFIIIFSVSGTFTRRHENRSVEEYRKVLAAETGTNGIRVLLEWHTDLDREIIVFDITAKTTGYVGFGLKRPEKSANGTDAENQEGMYDTDIVIGGIYPNGTSYLIDFRGVGNYAPVQDASQDWNLHAAYENTTHTFIRFSRKFETCDSTDDVPIYPKEPLKVIWALGRTDELTHHGSQNSGLSSEYLTFVPNVPEFRTIPKETINISRYPSWKTEVTVKMKDLYAYRCTFHGGPSFSKDVQAVAFKPVLNDPNAEKHVHHFTLYQCKVPKSVGLDFDRDLFDRLVSKKGGFDCYEKSDNNDVPIHMCMQVLYVWCPGEKEMVFPEQVGYLIAEDSRTYFMFEVHYENPDGLFNGLDFQVGIELFYTETLRRHNAGFLAVAHAVSESLFIPPETSNFKIEGRCTSKCTERSIPPGGIDVISVMLHAHALARKLTLRQFRGDQELPWLAVESQYDFHKQKMKPLLERRKILPGDNIVMECQYNSTTKNTTTIGGFSSTSEMCTAFLWYYPQINLEDCSSEYSVAKLKRFMYWNSHKNSSNFTWTPLIKERIQNLFIEKEHRESCIIPGDFHYKLHPEAPPIRIKPENVYKPDSILHKNETNMSMINQTSKCKKLVKKHVMSITQK